MPKESLADITQEQWIRACAKLGMKIDCRRGKGSHCLAKGPGGNFVTIQRNLHRAINEKIFKKLVGWGFVEEDILEALR